MLGLDGAGKTTVLYKLKSNKTIQSVPTLGFNVEAIQPNKSVSFTVWDVCGQEMTRHLWRYYFQGSDGIIYVIDSVDRNRFSVVKDDLARIVESDEMVGVPLVVLANKQDLPQQMR